MFHELSDGLQVKICGITNPVDARMCMAAGADALGFNLFLGSSRYIALNEASAWIRDLGPSPARVAVVVNPEQALLEQLRAAECFEWIQFHGDETPEFCSNAGFERWIKAVRVSGVSVPVQAQEYKTPDILLDAWSPTAYGGTGTCLNWNIAQLFIADNPAKKVLLAGGLNIENVHQAIRIARPCAVDVASGVELTPRKKEEFLVRQFVDRAKNA